MTLLVKDDLTLKANLIFDLLQKVNVKKEEEYIPLENVRMWINLYLLITCNYLVILGDDYPRENKTKYLKLFK